MKKSAPRLIILIVMLSTFLFSCTTEDDGIYMETEDITLSYSTIEYEILDLVNEYRSSINLEPLTIINLVSKEASDHNDYMISNGIISHDNFTDRLNNLVTKTAAKSVAENVAFGYDTASDVVNAWLKSDGHRKNIEKASFTNFGISTKKDALGRNYFTHIFISI